MDYGGDGGYSSGNVVQVISGGDNTGSVENWSGDQAVWATEEDYRAWINGEVSGDVFSNSSYDQRQSQARSGSEPSNKKTKNSQDVTSSNRSKAIGKMFFKTKLCCKFRNGTCPYITNCNFAHSIEELRRPPPNWQEIVAAHEEERGVSSEPKEEFQIPSIVSSSYAVETPRSYKGRHCKKFYTEEGCPYGENCTFLHDEQSKNRESVAISLGPGGYGGAGNGNGNDNGNGNSNGSNNKPSNWKTRICNKWELTGYCPFGSKCHFAHGGAELWIRKVHKLYIVNPFKSTMVYERRIKDASCTILDRSEKTMVFQKRSHIYPQILDLVLQCFEKLPCLFIKEHGIPVHMSCIGMVGDL